jgi:hypothetical protein
MIAILVMAERVTGRLMLTLCVDFVLIGGLFVCLCVCECLYVCLHFYLYKKGYMVQLEALSLPRVTTKSATSDLRNLW